MLRLHGYYRSGTSYRVRMALNLKGQRYDYVPVNLKEGEQRGEAYRRLNPQGLVPALETPDGLLTQSPAILEWIEETWPDPPLLPESAFDRARARAVAAVIGCDTHPIQNLRILLYLKAELGQPPDAVQQWARHWIGEGFRSVEALIGDAPGPFALGSRAGMADLYLLPQIYNAHRFGVDMAAFPRLAAIEAAAAEIPALADAHPSRQPDAPPAEEA